MVWKAKTKMEQVRAPINHPNRTDHKVEDSILKLKNKHMLWGAKKIRVLLFKQYPGELIPSVLQFTTSFPEMAWLNPKSEAEGPSLYSPFSTLRSAMKFGAQTIKGSF